MEKVFLIPEDVNIAFEFTQDSDSFNVSKEKIEKNMMVWI